ncbi:MAG: BlaI/MecI/CopY family transcriptional regulator [Lachnospiraceae bacterium]|jgi:predicted transcriptional regulator|nr:BlaI/MecI/CopY family transcriptional regulator [Lachnospiraceae bacterium]
MEQKITVSDSELEILEVLWAAGNALNAGEIRSALDAHKNWERTTVLTLIQRLVKKGALLQEKRAQNNREVYYYTPCIAREEYVRAETRNFVEKFFKGRSRNLAAALVDSEALTRKDIEELRDYFNQNL